MSIPGTIQILFFALLVLALTRPLGTYLHRVFEANRQPLPRFFGPIERALLRSCGVDAKREHTWGQYTLALIIFSSSGLLVTYLIQRTQHLLPWNPQKIGPVAPELAWNTAVSFTTNTNWQSYSGEAAMSYLTQITGLT